MIRLKFFTLLSIGFLFTSCNGDHSAVAVMSARNCSITSSESDFHFSEVTLFSNDESINKMKIPLSDKKPSNKIDICLLLEYSKVDIKKINLIAVILKGYENDTRHFVINRNQLDLIGKDTSFVFSEPIQ
jgi:hypothetical protein